MRKEYQLGTIYHRNKSVGGLQVSFLSSTGDIVFRAITAANGQFILRLEQTKVKPKSIRIMDANGECLLEEEWARKRNFTIAKDKPVPKTLRLHTRTSGPLLRIHQLNHLKRLLKKYGSDQKAITHHNNMIKRITPPLDAVSDIWSASAGALEGNVISIIRFREILSSIKPSYFGGRKPASIENFGNGSGRIFHRRNCLLTPPDYGQLKLATLFVSRTTSEYKTFSDQLEIGLAGVRTLERIVNNALPLSGLHSEKETFLSFDKELNQLSQYLPGFTPWPPDSGGNGIPELPGREYPPIEDFIPDVDLCDIRREQCIPSAKEMSSDWVEGNTGTYRIDSVTPLPAEENHVITITGEHFGPNVLNVTFPKCGGGTVRGLPITQTNSEVTVRVPVQATDGPIGLTIPLGVIWICNTGQTVNEIGTPGHFEAASPSIMYLRVNGEDLTCVDSGDQVLVDWYACPPGATVEFRYGFGAWEPVNNSDGRIIIAPIVSSEQQIRVHLRVTTNAGVKTSSATIKVVGPQPDIEISAVEFTQGIQTMFRGGGIPDNSLPLVAEKDTIVRVFIDVDRDGFNSNRMQVTGRIRISNENMDLSPANDLGEIINKGPFNQNDRKETNKTLNFIIPATICNGSLNLEIAIVGVWDCDILPRDTLYETISFRNVPALPVRIRRIKGKKGRSPNSSKSLKNVVNAFTYLPSPATDISVMGGVHEISWYAKAAGGYSTNQGLWILAADVAAEHWGLFGQAFDFKIWVGLTAKSNRGIMAWPDTWTCISHAEYEDESTFSKTAHEIGHCLGFGHVQNLGNESCDFVGCEDDRYEGPLPDIPFRVRLNSVITDARDLMGYEATSRRFLNPAFWVSAINKIENRW